VSEGERQTALRFSLGFTASQAIFLGAVTAMFAYFGAQYWFHADEMLARPVSGRSAWFGELLNSNGGMAGVVILGALALLSARYTLEAGWRFFSGRKAAILTKRGLVLHPSYWRRGEIPFEDILSVEVGREGSSWLFPRHALYLGFKERRPVSLRSVTTEGGIDSLKAFAAELNARRNLARKPDQV
jgi:hypothetical protein